MPKNVLSPINIVSAGDMSGNVTSSVTEILFLDNVSIQINLLSGSPTGSFDVQVSNDFSRNPDGSVRNTGTWNSLPLTISLAISAGSPSTLFADITETAASAVRLVYTRTSGTGSFNAILAGKSES